MNTISSEEASAKAKEVENEILDFLDLEKQKKFKTNYKSVFFRINLEPYLLSQEGWTPKDVEYSLGDSWRVTKMNVLQIGNITCYRPLSELKNAEFERFFGFGLLAGNPYSSDIIRFSYGTDLLIDSSDSSDSDSI